MKSFLIALLVGLVFGTLVFSIIFFADANTGWYLRDDYRVVYVFRGRKVWPLD